MLKSAVIFDVGNVLCLIHPQKSIAYFRDFDIDDIFECSEIGELSRGRMTESQAFDALQKRYPKLTLTAFTTGLNLMVDPAFNETISAFIQTLRQDPCCQLMLLSDTNPTHWALISQTNSELIKLFHHSVLSFDTSYRKADGPRTFNRACRLANIDPTHCIFIDDNERNLVSAEKAGILYRACFNLHDDDPQALIATIKTYRADIKRQQTEDMTPPTNTTKTLDLK